MNNFKSDFHLAVSIEMKLINWKLIIFCVF